MNTVYRAIETSETVTGLLKSLEAEIRKLEVQNYELTKAAQVAKDALDHPEQKRREAWVAIEKLEKALELNYDLPF